MIVTEAPVIIVKLLSVFFLNDLLYFHDTTPFWDLHLHCVYVTIASIQ